VRDRVHRRKPTRAIESERRDQPLPLIPLVECVRKALCPVTVAGRQHLNREGYDGVAAFHACARSGRHAHDFLEEVLEVTASPPGLRDGRPPQQAMREGAARMAPASPVKHDPAGSRHSWKRA
jgi:hypothetical protein